MNSSTADLFKEPVILNVRHPLYKRVIPTWCWTMAQLELVRESSKVVGLLIVEGQRVYQGQR